MNTQSPRALTSPKEQSGFALIITLVMISTLLTGLIFLLQRPQIERRVARRMGSLNDFQAATAFLKTVLAQETLCKNVNIIGRDYDDPALLNGPLSFALPGGLTLIGGQTFPGKPDLVIENLTLESLTPIGPPLDQTYLGMIRFRAKPAVTGPGQNLNPFKDEILPTYFKTAGGGSKAITQCFGPTSTRASCESSRGNFTNVTGNTPPRFSCDFTSSVCSQFSLGTQATSPYSTCAIPAPLANPLTKIVVGAQSYMAPATSIPRKLLCPYGKAASGFDTLWNVTCLALASGADPADPTGACAGATAGNSCSISLNGQTCPCSSGGNTLVCNGGTWNTSGGANENCAI